MILSVTVSEITILLVVIAEIYVSLLLIFVIASLM